MNNILTVLVIKSSNSKKMDKTLSKPFIRWNTPKLSAPSKCPSNINTQININIQMVPRKIIMRNSHKYIYRKSAINKKFDWLNKYLNAMSPKITSPFKIQTRKLRKASKKNIIKTEPDQFAFQKQLVCDRRKNILKRKASASVDDSFECQDHNTKILVLNQHNLNTKNTENNRSTEIRKHEKSGTLGSKNKTNNFFRMKKTWKKPIINQNIPSYSLVNQHNSNKQQVFFRRNPETILVEDFDLKPWGFSKEDDDDLKSNMTVDHHSYVHNKRDRVLTQGDDRFT